MESPEGIIGNEELNKNKNRTKILKGLQ